MTIDANEAPSRRAGLVRRTNETEVQINLVLDGRGHTAIETGVGFFDHMLHHVAIHGLLDLEIRAQGDYQVDDHHTVEDVGIALGKALAEALGEKRGIRRFGHAIVPMDESLALVACDFSGRGLLAFQASLPSARVGSFDTELVPEFLRAVAVNAGLTLHVQLLAGQNTHHIVEAIFKALGQSLRTAVEVDERRAGEIPSTKGVLE